MTAIVAWFTDDGKAGAASLYLGSDSRESRKKEDGNYEVLDDNFQKIFPAENTPDIFAFCGPTNGIESLMYELIRSAVDVRNNTTYGEGNEGMYSEDLFNTVLRSKSFEIEIV